MSVKRVSKSASARKRGALVTPTMIHDERVDPKNFVIYIGEDPAYKGIFEIKDDKPGVEHYMAERFVGNLHFLSNEDGDRPILVCMATDGGSWQDGMRMLGAMMDCKNPITVLATGNLCSMGTIIPLAADKLVIRPPSKYMIHLGYESLVGLEQLINTMDDERRKVNQMMFDLYTSRLNSQGLYCGQGEVAIQKMLETRMRDKIDVYLSTQRALEEGFADAVFDGDWENLRATEVNDDRRALVREVLLREYEIPEPKLVRIR